MFVYSDIPHVFWPCFSLYSPDAVLIFPTRVGEHWPLIENTAWKSLQGRYSQRALRTRGSGTGAGRSPNPSCQNLNVLRNPPGDFPSGPVVRTWYFHCRAHRFNPWPGTKIPHACGVWPKKDHLLLSFYMRISHLLLLVRVRVCWNMSVDNPEGCPAAISRSHQGAKDPHWASFFFSFFVVFSQFQIEQGS